MGGWLRDHFPQAFHGKEVIPTRRQNGNHRLQEDCNDREANRSCAAVNDGHGGGNETRVAAQTRGR